MIMKWYDELQHSTAQSHHSAYPILLNTESVHVNKHARIEVEVAALQVTPTPQKEAVAAMIFHPGSCLCIDWFNCAL